MSRALRSLTTVAAALVAGAWSDAAATPLAAVHAFSPAVRIDNADSTVYANAAVAVNAAGDAVAIWDSGFGPGWDIYGARRPLGGSWSPPTLLTSDYGRETHVAALGADGTAYFNALSRDDDGDRILSWASDGAVTETGIGGHDDTGEVATDTHGDVVAYTINANHAITYAYAAAGASSWTSTTAIHFFGTSTVALGPNHTYYVSYASNTDTGPGDPLVLGVRRVDGLTGASTLLLRRRICGIGPLGAESSYNRPFDIAVSRGGSAVVTWRCRSRKNASIKAMHIDAAGRPGRLVLLARSRRTHVGARLSPPRAGFARARATVVFSRAIGHGRRDVLATSSRRRGRWTRPSVKAAGVRPARESGIEGNLVWTPTGAALYTYRDGSALYGISRPPGGFFGSPARLYKSSDLHLAPPAAIAPDGTATVLQLLRGVALRVRTGTG